LLKDPFNNGGLKGGQFFLEFLLKSSLFGEWNYPGLESLAVNMLVLTIIIIIIILAYFLFSGVDITKNYGYIFLLNIIIPFLLEMKFRTDLPVACSQDFRYIAPVLISTAYFLGKAVSHFSKPQFRFLKYPINISILAFCTLSAIFLLSLGYYN
jgi:hypothetical protein